MPSGLYQVKVISLSDVCGTAPGSEKEDDLYASTGSWQKLPNKPAMADAQADLQGLQMWDLHNCRRCHSNRNQIVVRFHYVFWNLLLK